MLSKKKIEIVLEGCETIQNPKAQYEQYITPTPIAADLLNLATLKGDIVGKIVFDLGCGTGRLAIGAFLEGAKVVRGFDIDPDAIEIARRNSLKLNADVRWDRLDISDLDEKCDTVIQNPPFGVKKKGADRQFLKTALGVGKVIYTMHKTTTRDFIKGYLTKLGGTVTELKSVEFPLPFSYSFHKKRIKRIEVDIYRVERRD
jgi:putative methylase